MRTLLIIPFVTLAYCRPEAGYNYRPPFTGGIQIGSGSSGGGGSFHQTGSISSSFGGSSFGGTGFGSGGGFGHGGGVGSGGLIGVGSGGFSGGGGSSSSAGFIGGSSTSGGFVSGGSTGFVQGPALVQKHIYVHVPPPEPEEFIPQRQVSAGVAQKHYKIIFIKAPTAPSLSQQQIALAAQNQEKTIVYVLVKKPDDIADISIPAVAPTQPSKPEVYFIKYKAQKQVTGASAAGLGVAGGAISSGHSFTGSSGPLIGTTASGSGSALSGGSLISGTTGSGGISSSVISSGSASSSVGGIPAPQYGPPGKSGPY